MPFELVTRAFERTIEKKGTPNKSYMGGILKKWHEAGALTLDAVLAHEQKTRGQSTSQSVTGNTSGTSGESTFDVDDFFAAALDRSFAGSLQSDGENKE